MKTPSANPLDEIKIRSVEKDDIAEILKIQEETNLSFWSQEDYENEIARKDSIFKVAVSDEGKINAFLLVRLLIGKGLNSFESAEIINIAVKKSSQKIGIGQKIFDSMLSEIKNLGIKEIWLDVRKSNYQAINFYQKNDFTRQALRKNYYKSPLEDALILKLSTN